MVCGMWCHMKDAQWASSYRAGNRWLLSGASYTYLSVSGNPTNITPAKYTLCTHVGIQTGDIRLQCIIRIHVNRPSVRNCPNGGKMSERERERERGRGANPVSVCGSLGVSFQGGRMPFPCTPQMKTNTTLWESKLVQTWPDLMRCTLIQYPHAHVRNPNYLI